MFTWKDYVKDIFQDSFAIWERGERLTVFAGVVIASLLLGLLLAFGVAVTFKPEAGLWVGAVLLGWLGVLLFFVSPFRLWKMGKVEINKLQDEITPHLDVSFDPKSSNCVEIIKDDNGKKVGRIYRILVFNTSKSKSIERATVVILDIKDWDHAYMNTPLETIDGFGEFNLDSEARQHINVFASRDGRDVEDIKIMYAASDAMVDKSFPREPRDICIQVRGKDTPSKTVWIRTGTTPAGKLTITRIDEVTDVSR